MSAAHLACVCPEPVRGAAHICMHAAHVTVAVKPQHMYVCVYVCMYVCVYV